MTHTRRRFLQLSMAGMGLIMLPDTKLFQPSPLSPAPNSLILSADVIRAVSVLMKKHEIPTFPNNTWRARIHPDSEYDLLSDHKVQNIYQLSSYRDEANPLIKGVIPTVYRIEFWRDTTAPIGRLKSGVKQIGYLPYHQALWVQHSATLAEHRNEDVYSTIFYGPGASSIHTGLE